MRDSRPQVPLLLTATIRPHHSPGIFTVCQTEESRYREYCAAIKWLSWSKLASRIVVAENSHSSFVGGLRSLCHNLETPGLSIEFLNLPFPDETLIMGKGYGEGWLITEAVRHSSLINDSGRFIKLTGRYKVRNLYRIFEALASSISGADAYDYVSQSIALFNEHIPIVSTILFASSSCFWLKHFSDCYLEVDDLNGWALEAEIAKRLLSLISVDANIGELTHPLIINGTNTKDNSSFIPKHRLYYLTLKAMIGHLLGRRVDISRLCPP